MNYRGIKAIFVFEMARMRRTVFQSIAAPVIATSLYFIVFGSAIGSKMTAIDGVTYGAFIVPGILLLSILNESVSNASFGIYLPRFAGTFYEVQSAPLSPLEIILGYVGAAATKSLILAMMILLTAKFFVSYTLAHPLWFLLFLILTCFTFSLLGFIIGIMADSFEKIQIVPALLLTPLTFLGGSFYSIELLPEFWYHVSLFNPIVYLVNGFRWCFYEVADVSIFTSVGMTAFFLTLCVLAVFWIFKTGYRLRQ